jgi:hypothetical protein
MIRLLTLGALILWLAKPSCAICCVESVADCEDRGTPAVIQLPIADNCCPSSEGERGLPSARTCCLLDEYSNDFSHHPTDSHRPNMEVVFERPVSVGALPSILPVPQPSPDLSTTYLMCSVLLI